MNNELRWGDDVTDYERETALKEHNRRQEKMIKKGKALVFLFAAYHILATVASAVFDFNIIILAIRLALVALLLFGHSWVKYFFGVAAAISAMAYLFLLLGGVMDFSEVRHSTLIITALVVEMAAQLFTCIIFFTSKSITEYMYFKKNG